MILLGKRSMHLSSISRTFSAHPHLSFSTLSMNHTEKVQISFVATPSVSVKVYQLLFLTVFGSISLTMMLLLSLWSLLKGTLGTFTTSTLIIIWRFLLFWFYIYNLDSDYLWLLFLRYVDAILTIPKGTLFPMCGMNLAFDRELIGPAMYFGLMGDGQPIGRYDDMWAGWCIKVFSWLIAPPILWKHNF